MIHWKNKLYKKVQQHIARSVDPQRGASAPVGADKILLTWWNTYGPRILNDFEFEVDELTDLARQDELNSLRLIIESDANIDNEDINVKRVLFHLKSFIDELDEEVDYEDGESIEGEEEAS